MINIILKLNRKIVHRFFEMLFTTFFWKTKIFHENQNEKYSCVCPCENVPLRSYNGL
jgi:hypothetical protein